MPMIVKPVDWKFTHNEAEKEFKIIEYGGYINNKLDRNSFMHKSLKNSGSTKLYDDKIIKTINYIQSIPFKINLNMLYHILNIIKDNIILDESLVFNLHSKSINLVKIKEDGNTVKVNEILRHNSYVHTNISTISTSLTLINQTFYHPIFMDWRARLYTNNVLLSFTYGTELTRSILYFANGVKLNEKGLESLKIYTANCFGLDKKSYNFRLNWVNENLDKILNIDSNFWLEAKENLLFLACAYELKEYYKDPVNFLSRLPIYLDCTSNGLQHLSAMTNDLTLAK